MCLSKNGTAMKPRRSILYFFHIKSSYKNNTSIALEKCVITLYPSHGQIRESVIKGRQKRNVRQFDSGPRCVSYFSDSLFSTTSLFSFHTFVAYACKSILKIR